MTLRPTTSRCPRGGGRKQAAFTLVELLISIAIVLVLILGINQVFSITSQGVAGGQALSTVIRDNRSAHSVFYDDFRGIVMPANAVGGGFDNGPGMLIRSERQYAYRSRTDHLGDPNGAGTESPTNAEISDRDLDGNNIEGDAGEITHPAIYNERSHRIDRMAFFARGMFRRQTGGTFPDTDVDPYVAHMSSPEAYIWYGHLRLPDTSSPVTTAEQYVHRGPGETPYNQNRDNAYASSWALGRVVLTMRAPDVNGFIFDSETGGTAQNYIDRPDYPEPPTAADVLAYYQSLAPFERKGNWHSTGNPVYNVQWSRYDLAGTTIEEYRDVLNINHEIWLVDPGDADPTADPITGLNEQPWWVRLSDTRFQGNPIPDRPLDSPGVARAAPVFLRGCSQFIVEFAGDFVTQVEDTTHAQFGLVFPQDPPQPDGVTDFVVRFDDDNGNGLIDSADEQQTVRRETRWYGMPRDSNGDGVIPGWVAGRNANQLPDVVPLRDVVSSGTGTLYAPGDGYALEKFTPPGDADALPPAADYAASAGMGDDARYIAAWGPGAQLVPKPRMIRITLALDEPRASLANEQTYEYVIELP